MAFWPFKRRKRSTADSKRPMRDLESSSLQTPPSPSSSSPPRHRGFLGRKSSRRSQHDHAMAYSPASQDNNLAGPSDYRDSPMTDHSSSPYLAHQGRSGSSSPASSNRPHKQSSFIRRLSLRRKDKSKPQPPPSAYESHITRRNTKTGRPRHLPGRENDRPLSPGSTAPRTSMESQLSSRAYKIRTLDVFSPYPTLHYDESSSPTSDRSRHRGASLTPTRTNSRRTASRATQEWRYRAPLVSVENLGNHRSRVDDLVDELDARAISEAMERDRRRKEKKKKEYEERLRLKLERRALQQQQQQQQQGLESEPHHHHNHHNHHNHHHQEHPYYPNNAGESSTAGQRDPRIGHAVSRTQTPLSWFNDSPSVEDVSAGLRRFPSGPGVVTPVSMDSPDERAEDLSAAEEAPAIVVDQSSPPRAKAKAPGWASFIKRAATTRLKKDHNARSIRSGQSTLISDSEGEEFGNVQQHHQEQSEVADPGPSYLEVEDLRHREGQTPGRHVSSEVVLAMNALETGHIQDTGVQEDEYEDEMRDSVLPTPPLAPYHHHNGSQTSSRSSLAPPNLGLRGGGVAATSKSHSPMDESRDSPSLPPHHPARYSPSVNRHSSGAASPDNGARSVMSTSLASIDSEGSWLSGKINPRVSAQQISPLRASASSLRKRYNEMEDHDGSMDDDYFTGVRKPASSRSHSGRINNNKNDNNDDDKKKESSADEEDIGGARLDLDDTDEDEDDDMDDNGSLSSEAERNMWREGMEKRVELRNGMRAKSREGMLDDFDDEPRLIDSPADERSASPQLQTNEFATPQEQSSFPGTATSSEFRTPLEHPALRMEYHAM